jgi:hypothetical protein
MALLDCKLQYQKASTQPIKGNAIAEKYEAAFCIFQWKKYRVCMYVCVYVCVCVCVCLYVCMYVLPLCHPPPVKNEFLPV